MADQQEALHFLDYWRVINSRKEIVIAVSLLCVLAGLVVTRLMPKEYMASTVIAVREETQPLDVFNREAVRFNPLFLPTQFEIIQSRRVLDEVIRRLNLVAKLGSAYGYSDNPDRMEITYDILSDAMRVQQYRDTNLIEIMIVLSQPKDTAPEVAADTANMVSAVFRDQRESSSREEMERALRALFESFQEQKQRVTGQERKVEDIREKYNLDVMSTSRGAESALDKQSLAQVEEQSLVARLNMSSQKARLDNIERLSAEDLRVAAPYIVSNDPSLADLVAQKRSLEVRLAGLQESYGPKHPEVVSVRATIAGVNRQVEDALKGLRTGLRVAYEGAKAKFDILDAEVTALKARQRKSEGTGYREFDAAVRELEHSRNIRDVMEMRYLQERIELRIPETTVELIERATPPRKDSPISPKPLLNIILSIIVGLGCGVGLAYFVEYLDTSVKTIEDIEASLEATVLGVIPQKVKPFTDEQSASLHGEAYRVMRTNIRFSKNLKKGKAIACTSGSVGEGKSLTVFNLGATCAQLGERVIIVDADLHRPRQHKMAGVSGERGLANVLMGTIGLDDAVLPTPVENLFLLPSGRVGSQTHGLLDTVKMSELVEELERRYDVVLFDTPPIIGVSDAVLLAREVAGVLLIIQHRKYPRAVSKRAKDILQSAGGNLVGVVLNNVNISRDYSYYYYHHYYSHYGKGQKEGRS
ncbi:MAG: polysaccharide biosynthesis tyrosine autokinase [Lentisphaerae bacterium]|nr:polysaccharide biosynthesis tyrosine autokinase [Lentisphaerota bacterium]